MSEALTASAYATIKRTWIDDHLQPETKSQILLHVQSPIPKQILLWLLMLSLFFFDGRGYEGDIKTPCANVHVHVLFRYTNHANDHVDPFLYFQIFLSRIQKPKYQGRRQQNSLYNYAVFVQMK